MERLEKYASAEQITAKVKEVLEVASEHDWLKKRVMPYGYGITIKDMMDYPRDFEHYTRTSLQIVRAEINGLIDIMNVWLEHEAEEHITVVLPNGKQGSIPKSFLEDYIAMGAKEGE